MTKFSCHMVTVLHRKIRDKVRAARNDSIWLSGEDVCQAFKPLKMGLRTAILFDEPWLEFVDTYDRILKTGETLFNVKVEPEEREKDLDYFGRLGTILRDGALVDDTILVLNKEIKNKKRILVEDCSSI